MSEVTGLPEARLVSAIMRLRAAGLPALARYLIATVLVVSALALLLVFPGLVPVTGYIAFFPVIILCAIVLDRGTSIYATLLAAALSLRYLIVAASETREIAGLVIFIATGVVSAVLVEALRHAVEALSETNEELVLAHAEADRQSGLLATLVEQIPDPIYVKDADGRFLHVNSATAQVFGISPALAVGRRDRDFVSAEQADAIESIDRAVLTSKVIQVVEERVAVAGKGTRTFLSTKAPWLDPAGRLSGIVGVSHDIEVRKTAELALKHADEQKQVLLYDINHRIKNHLQSIVGLMSVASQRATTLAAARSALADAGHRLSVLSKVYNRLQINDGHPVVDTRSFVEELCAELRTSLVDTRAIRFEVSAAAVELESNRAVTLGLVINELVQNALKYAFPDDRPGAVKVRLTAVDDDLELVVADDGVGMVDGAAPAGTGTGQRLIAALTQQLGGTVARAGPGTCWTIRFPLGAKDAAEP